MFVFLVNTLELDVESDTAACSGVHSIVGQIKLNSK